MLLEACNLYAPQELIWERVAPSHTGLTQSKVIGLGCKCEVVSKAYGSAHWSLYKNLTVTVTVQMSL